VERLRIDSSGNVGIGATSPTSALTVQGTITGTAVTQSATDTTAGRLTKVGDFGLGDSANLTEQVDLDDVAQQSTTRILVTGTQATSTPPGFSSVNFVQNFVRLNGDRATQLAFDSPGAGSNRLAVRGFGTNGFTSWNELYGKQNILGTVSESSGTPTGAIIQRGSNANGEFVRYADGTQVCWSRATVTQSSTSRLVKDQTFPAEFSSFGGINVQVSVPVHSNSEFTNLDRLTVKSWGPAMGSGTATTTDVGITVFTDSGAVSADSEISNVNVNATGRWF
jgi:hypothetical protein